jgi:hypothetical protein
LASVTDVGLLPLDQEDGFVDAVPIGGVLREDLDLPLLQRGEALVHVEEDAGEQVGFVAAHGTADLHDHVAPEIWVLGQQQRLDPLLQVRHRLLGLFDLLSHQLALVTRRLGQHFATGCHILTG